ncbi:hypothetical protein GJAV_G00128150 [Gymnothorax javanicus]|nr:hypothetical protein GJAV_G00128150 [Gymnothorax javanicus]
MECYLYPVTVAGEWGSIPPKALKNKLQIYFQSNKKSGGGDCQVEWDGGKVTVLFKSQDDRKRVVGKENHDLTVENIKVKLRLSLCEEKNPEKAADGASLPPEKHGEMQGDHARREEGAAGINSAASGDQVEKLGTAEPNRTRAVLLENMPEDLPRVVLSMVVEQICGSSEDGFSMEVIRDASAAVVTFSRPDVSERFLAQCGANDRFRQFGLWARALEPSESVWVEGLPNNYSAELLELYFAKELEDRSRDVAVSMVPEEQAAIVTFHDPRVAERVVQRKHCICKMPVSVYPYLPTLKTALYGAERPEWRLPEAFTETLHPALSAYLLREPHQASIAAQMRDIFCQVDLSHTHVDLRPLPSLLKQPGLTANKIAAWRGKALQAFHTAVARYRYVECTVSLAVWSRVEAEIRQLAGKDPIILPDPPKVAIAGLAEDVVRIQQMVEELVRRANESLEQERDGVSEAIFLSPGVHQLLEQMGLMSELAQTHPALSASYGIGTKTLILMGPSKEVYWAKSWILEQRLQLKQRPLDVAPEIRSFLSAADSLQISRKLFGSRGVHATLHTENEGPLVLLGASEEALSRATQLLGEALASHSVEVVDEALLHSREWADLLKRLTEGGDPFEWNRVAVQVRRGGAVNVAGFQEAVRDAAKRLDSFVQQHTNVEEVIPVRSLALLLFLQNHSTSALSIHAEQELVKVRFEQRPRPRVVLGGTKVQVQALKSQFTHLISTLITDQLTVDKPGTAKYFLENEQIIKRAMNERKCVVVLQKDRKEGDEEDDEEDGTGLRYDVQTDSGVLVSVRKADLTQFLADAVVNAANVDLDHCGGLALALSRAAGPELQRASDAIVRTRGKLRPGDVAITEAGRLPCQHVIHAVGPCYYDNSESRSVELLAQVVGRSLELAEQRSCTSVAMPAISSGIFGFPLRLCAETIARAVREHCVEHRPGRTSLTTIHLVNNDCKTVRAMAQAVKTVFTSDDRPQMVSKRERPQEADWQIVRHSNQGAEWNSPAERAPGLADYSRDKPSDSRELETIHMNGGLVIVLREGSIADASTEAVVNTIGKDLDLTKGAVSNAILKAAGDRLQTAMRQTGRSEAQHGDVLHTNGFHLGCEIFHTVCPTWDAGTGNAKQTLSHLVKMCMQDAEKHRCRSLAFPAIGTGHLGFPKTLVAQTMLSEVQAFSQRGSPSHLRRIEFIVHPSDTQTVECFLREFRGHGQARPGRPPSSQSQQDETLSGQSEQVMSEEYNTLQKKFKMAASPSESLGGHSKPKHRQAFFGQILSSAPGAHKMEIGHLTLEVSEGDITKENTDVIVNSSNPNFSLMSGVSKAILEGAGPQVQDECAVLGSRPHNGVIVTRGGKLLCGNIVHVVVETVPASIRAMVLHALQKCVELKAESVAFPALGTGSGGLSPSSVADAMLSAVADFVKKKHSGHLKLVKIIIFQTEMISVFHNCMRRMEREGLPVEKGMLTKMGESFWSYISGTGGDSGSKEAGSVLEGEWFPPAVFEMCGEDRRDVYAAKVELEKLLKRKLVERYVREPGTSRLSSVLHRALKQLQRRLAVQISFEPTRFRIEGQERDVSHAESEIRRMIREAESSERQRQEAEKVQGCVQWSYKHRDMFVPFDLYTNLMLETAYDRQQSRLKIFIDNREYEVDMTRKKACGKGGDIPLKRTDMRGSQNTGK